MQRSRVMNKSLDLWKARYDEGLFPQLSSVRERDFPPASRNAEERGRVFPRRRTPAAETARAPAGCGRLSEPRPGNPAGPAPGTLPAEPLTGGAPGPGSGGRARERGSAPQTVLPGAAAAAADPGPPARRTGSREAAVRHLLPRHSQAPRGRCGGAR
ncbi:unnamed protein product [Bubo scandiacus]